ncbi:MAG: hypothetical protein K2W95_05795 [Candidatus Obscuribacterales bacterium]|nr:hypothetical protein [Candidatus Obscuribacterales bacterium]
MLQKLMTKITIGLATLAALAGLCYFAFRCVQGDFVREPDASHEPSGSEKTAPRTTRPLDEYYALCKRYNLPEGATDADISRAIDAAFEAGRRRSYGLPPDAPESEVRKHVTRSYGLPEDCSDAELSAAINKRFEACRRRSAGLPENTPESELRKATARSYGLPEDCSDAELSDAINKRFDDGYRSGLGLKPRN